MDNTLVHTVAIGKLLHFVLLYTLCLQNNKKYWVIKTIYYMGYYISKLMLYNNLYVRKTDYVRNNNYCVHTK